VPEPDVTETFSYVTTEVRDRFPKLAYIHFIESRITGDSNKEGTTHQSLKYLRDIWNAKGERLFFTAGGFTKESAEEAINVYGGAVVFGRHFVANPDLPLRFLKGLPLNKYDRSTFYSPTGPEARKG